MAAGFILKKRKGDVGVYVPPPPWKKTKHEKSEIQNQRVAWEALRRSINGLVNKVNAANINNIVPELLVENLVRGRGLFSRSIIKSQAAFPAFTDVFAALAAAVNAKFPGIGHLLARRVVLQLQRTYKRNDKPRLVASVTFLAHLVNQQVAHELVALELLTLLLEKPTDDSVHVAVAFVAECGSLLQEISPRALGAVFERFRGILHEGEIDKRVQFLIEGVLALRKAKQFQGLRPELDLVEEEDRVTHRVSLSDEIDGENEFDIFSPDPEFAENENRYEQLKKQILLEEEEESSEEEEEEECHEEMKIRDETGSDLVNLRKIIYLALKSCLNFEEAGHELLKLKLKKPWQEMEVCVMILECCSQERTYHRYYGLLAQRFCLLKAVYRQNFEACFVRQYATVHRLETDRLRNVAMFFAHLLSTDALPWHVLACIRLTEDETTTSSRIFVKILFQELSDHLGIRALNERLSDPGMLKDSIFPKDNPKTLGSLSTSSPPLGWAGSQKTFAPTLRASKRRGCNVIIRLLFLFDYQLRTHFPKKNQLHTQFMEYCFEFELKM